MRHLTLVHRFPTFEIYNETGVAVREVVEALCGIMATPMPEDLIEWVRAHWGELDVYGEEDWEVFRHMMPLLNTGAWLRINFDNLKVEDGALGVSSNSYMFGLG